MLDIRTPAYRQNPYPTFQKLRAEHPICQMKPHGYWLIAKYSDVEMILKNPDLFSSANLGEEPTLKGPEFLLFSRGLLGLDKPEHTRLRKLISKAFIPSSIRSLEPKIRFICKALNKKILNKSSIDFIQEFALPLPVMLMGIEEDRLTDFKRWITLLLSWRNKTLTTEMMDDVQQMYDYFNELINRRRKEPQGDLVSTLILTCDTDGQVSNDEVLAFIRLLLIAGTDTTTNLLGNAMLALLSHPQHMEQIHQDSTKITSFIEEVLRFDGPALSLSRRVTEDIEISGIRIRKNEIVLPLIASANHDETVFSNPTQFDIERSTRNHFAFGTGIHHCIGSQLAKLQARIAFEELFKTLSCFTRTDAEPLEYLDSFFFRGISKLDLSLQ